jgi:hypothetical protein
MSTEVDQFAIVHPTLSFLTFWRDFCNLLQVYPEEIPNVLEEAIWCGRPVRRTLLLSMNSSCVRDAHTTAKAGILRLFREVHA